MSEVFDGRKRNVVLTETETKELEKSADKLDGVLIGLDPKQTGKIKLLKFGKRKR